MTKIKQASQQFGNREFYVDHKVMLTENDVTTTIDKISMQ